MASLEKCMLKPVRTAAGLGNPPNKWVNNLCESLNNVIKEEIDNNSVDLITFLEKIKERVFGQQLEELIRGIHGMGEYRLIDSMAQYSVTPVQWTSMSPDQRRAHVCNIFSEKDIDCSDALSLPSTYAFSVPLEQSSLQKYLPLSSIKELWATAEFILVNGKTFVLLSGNYSVCDFDQAYNVKNVSGNRLMYSCDCEKFKSFDGLCGHVLAVAEKEGVSKMLLDRYVCFGGNVNKIIHNAVPIRAGDKSHEKKKRKGKNNVLMSPIIKTNSSKFAAR